MSDIDNREETQEMTAEELSELLQVRRDKLKFFQDEGRDPFAQTRFDRTAWSREIADDFDAFDGKTVSVAGRIMTLSRNIFP